MTIEEGKAAPQFTLPDTEGNKVRLKELRGKHVIIYFYPKDDTPGCTKEACSFRDLKQTFEQHNAVILGACPRIEAVARGSHFESSFSLI